MSVTVTEIIPKISKERRALTGMTDESDTDSTWLNLAIQESPVTSIDGKVDIDYRAMSVNTLYEVIHRGKMQHVVKAQDGTLRVYELIDE